MSPVCAVPGAFVPTKTAEEPDPLDEEVDPELVPEVDPLAWPSLVWLDELFWGPVPLAEGVDAPAVDVGLVDPV